MNVLRGNKHQGMPFFNDRYSGRQCTIIAVVALCFMSLKLAGQWSASDIDNVLTEGHVRYIEQIFNMGIEPRNIQHNEIPTQIPNLLNTGVNLTISAVANFYGVVGQDENTDSGAYDFESSLVMAFEQSHHVIATFSDYTIAFYYCDSTNTYYLHDSHACGPCGERGDPFGFASLIEFNDLQTLQQYIVNTYFCLPYELSAIAIGHSYDEYVDNSISCNLFSAVPIDLKTEPRNISVSKHDDSNLKSKDSMRKNRKRLYKNRYETNVDHDHTYHKFNEVFSVESNAIDKPMKVSMPEKPLNDLTESLLPNFFHDLINNPQKNKTSTRNKQPSQCLSDKRSKLFLKDINMKPEFECKICKRMLFYNQVQRSVCSYDLYGVNEKDLLCCWCKRTLKDSNMCFLDYERNNLNAGEVPTVLKSLSIIEKRCISLINTFFSLIVLPAFPVGQLGMKGLVIHLPMSVENMTAKIQLCTCNSNSSIAYVYPSSTTKKPSIVDCQKVLQALEWLKCNNPLYKNVTINMSCQHDNTHDNISTDSCFLEEIGTIPIDHCMPDINIDEAMKSKSPTCILPLRSEKDSLVDLSKLEHGEEMAFPTLFPYGIAGFSDKRIKKLTLLKYYRSRLYNVDDRWRCDIPYLLTSVNTYEKQALFQLVSIFLKVGKKSSSNLIQARDVTNGKKMSDNINIVKNSYMFMKSLRGTAAYWKDVLYNLLAMVKNLGSPTLFMTLSANDYHWPELADMLGVSLKDLPQAVKKNPLMTALHFERRWRALFKHVINGPQKPLGVVKDYFARVEFQSRGSPHLHIFFWIETAPTLQSSTSEELVNYIDKVICTQIPDKNEVELHALVSKLQVLSHRKTCQRGSKCRFYFPYDVCNKTKILPSIDINESRKFYATKRTTSDTMVNAYNPTILLNWQANMDIQMVNGPISVAYYVCSYVCKSEPNTLRNALSETIHNIEESVEPVSLRSRMCKIGFCLLKHRTLSTQEAAYRIGHLQLTWSSRTVVRVIPFFPERRYKRLKPQEELDALSPNSSDIFLNNIIDYYYARPQILQNVSLFSFCRSYEVVHNDKKLNENYYRLDIPGEKYLKKRKKSAVVRISFPLKGSDEYYYSYLLLFFPHSHSKDLTIEGKSYRDVFLMKYSCFDREAVNIGYKFSEIENLIQSINIANFDSSCFAPNTHENISEPVIDESFGEIVSQGNENSSEERNLQNKLPHDETCFPESHSEIFEKRNLNELSCNNTLEENTWHRISTQVTTTYIEHLKKLTKDQLKVLNYVQQCIKERCSIKIFITGGAGVGKSFLINVLVDYLKLVSANMSGQNPVLVMAPTGVAAHNIKGETIHSALKVPVEHTFGYDYSELSSTSLHKLRGKLQNVKTIVIDEISMVSSKMLQYIHNRLQYIKDNDLPFGGLNVIVVGDFFQLRPVRGQFAFKHSILWPMFKPFLLLENMRQVGNKTYASMLNRIRVGQLMTEDMSLLQTRLSKVNYNPEDATIPLLDCLHIFPTRQQVNLHNDAAQMSLQANIVVIKADHYFSEKDIEPNSQLTNESLIPEDDRLAGGLPRILSISIGSRIMLLRNIALSFGLVNGARGIITNFEINSVTNEVTHICVKFDNMEQMPSGIVAQNGSVVISKYKQEYLYQGRMIVREMFPLVKCWAATVHKVQGLTLSSTAMSLDSNIFQHGQAYVALSRVHSLDSLILLSLCFDKITADPSVIEEYAKLYRNNF